MTLVELYEDGFVWTNAAKLVYDPTTNLLVADF